MIVWQVYHLNPRERELERLEREKRKIEEKLQKERLKVRLLLHLSCAVMCLKAREGLVSLSLLSKT